MWLLGSALYHADKRGLARAFFNRKRAGVLLALAAALCTITLPVSRIGMLPFEIADMAVGSSFALLVWAFLLLDPPFPKFARPLANYGADASFSLYVTHFPLLVLASTIALEGSRLQPGGTAMALLVGSTALATIYGGLFARATEGNTPLIRQWLRRRLTRPVILPPTNS